jgi:hypothetical protein
MNFIAASLSSVFKTKDSVLKESPDELASHLRIDLLDLTQTELTEEQTATLVSMSEIFLVLSQVYLLCFHHLYLFTFSSILSSCNQILFTYYLD